MVKKQLYPSLNFFHGHAGMEKYRRQIAKYLLINELIQTTGNKEDFGGMEWLASVETQDDHAG
jgi:hypothetical protein